LAIGGKRRIQPSMVFVIVAVLAAATWAIASRDDHDYSRPPPVTLTDAQLASLTEDERALVRWFADTAPKWDGLVRAVAGFDDSAGRQDLFNLERSCRSITDAAELLDARLPAPHPEADRSLREGLASYAAGGHACRAAARGEAGQIEVMTAAFADGDRALITVADLVPHVPCPDGTEPSAIGDC
jgi:hypothetical protein